jgi:hypothetical protein
MTWYSDILRRPGGSCTWMNAMSWSLHDMISGYREMAGWFMYLDERHVLELTSHGVYVTWYPDILKSPGEGRVVHVPL